MDEHDFEVTRKSLVREAMLYPPMEPFEAPYRDPQKAMEAVIAKCMALSGTDANIADKQRSWFASIVLRSDIAFYGSVLNDITRAKDVDVIQLSSGGLPLYRFQPAHIHVFNVTEACGGHPSGFSSTFLAGPLLFPNPPDVSILRRIEAERRAMQRAPFFNGGIGELLTHAAFKALHSPSEEDSKLPAFPAWLRFRVDLQWMDFTNMRRVTYSPHEVNEQIRDQMRQLKDPEVHALAVAAMRRLHVRESERPALATRFVAELRAKR